MERLRVGDTFWLNGRDNKAYIVVEVNPKGYLVNQSGNRNESYDIHTIHSLFEREAAGWTLKRKVVVTFTDDDLFTI